MCAIFGLCVQYFDTCVRYLDMCVQYFDMCVRYLVICGGKIKNDVLRAINLVMCGG